MRKSLGTALVPGFVTLAATAFAQSAMQDARVTNVDRGGKSFFSAQWNTGSANYWTTPRTTFHVGSQPTSFDYIKAGSVVRVSSHMEGDKAIADDVVFRPIAAHQPAVPGRIARPGASGH
jgi:hypothetical protein